MFYPDYRVHNSLHWRDFDKNPGFYGSSTDWANRLVRLWYR
jgi:hypothetical protein